MTPDLLGVSESPVSEAGSVGSYMSAFLAEIRPCKST